MTSTNSAQQFCVRWNSYQSNLQNSFPKLLLNEHFVDVSLACEGQLIKCHKVVLSACSTYFEQMLSQNPCQHPIIFMKDMKFWEVRALVDFMYRGEVNVTQEELSSLLKAAEALQVRGLYGYEQQRAAAAAAACTKTEGSNEEQPKTPSLPASTTVQECTSNSRPSSPQQEDSNDQMVKLEEEIMMMEEQSISDMDSHLENDFAPLGNSQDFDGFVGDQRYPPPPHCGEMDSSLAGPSGLTMSAISNTSTNSSQERNLLPDGSIGSMSWKINKNNTSSLSSDKAGYVRRSTIWEALPKGSRFSLPNLTSSCQMTGQASSGDEDANSPMKRIRRSERELSEAAGCIVRGLTFQSVSDRYKIPISTIRFYMARKGILPRRKRGRTNRFDDMPKQDQMHHNGPPNNM